MNQCKAQFVLCLSGSLKVYLGSFQVVIRFWTLLKFTCAQEWASLCALHVAWLQNQRITSFYSTSVKNQSTHLHWITVDTKYGYQHRPHAALIFRSVTTPSAFQKSPSSDWDTRICLYQSRERVFFRLQLLSTYLGEFAVHIHVSDM